MADNNDLPQSILVVLVFLAVLISILGTFAVLNESRKLASAPTYSASPVQTGKISLRIQDPYANQQVTTGKISLAIEDPEVRKNG